MTPELYDYQVDVLGRARARMRGGARRVIIQADCGAGKTHIIAEVARCAAALGKRVLILAHRRKLIKQIRERLSEFKVPHGVLMSGFFVATNAVVLIGSRDTLISRGLALLPDAELVIVDECHNLPAESYLAIASRYPRAFLLGFTATPCDNKGNGLGKYFDAMECAVPTSELIRRGRLVPARCFAPKGLSEKRRRSRRSRGLAGDVVSHWQEYAEGRRTLLFAGNKTTSLACMKRFLDEGIKAEHIDAFTPDDDDESREDTRDAVMRRLKAADTLVVCNVGLWTEGVDIPEIDAVIIFRAMESFRFYKQAVSRGMRACAGKKDCVVLDHSGAVEYHGFPDNDVRWTLDPGRRVEERNAEDMDEGRQRKPITCPRCGGMFEAASPTCPFCGFVLRKAKDALASVNRDERLVELDRTYEAVNDQDIMSRQWRSYIGMVKSRGQNLSVAAAMFRGRFKKPPWEAGVSPLPTDRACWRMTVQEVWPEWGQKPVEEF